VRRLILDFRSSGPGENADLTRGTGHFNLAQGAVITAQGIGAALSTSLAGVVVVHAGYSAAFLVLAGIAASGRACHAVELHSAYVDVAVTRWQNFTALAATLEATGEACPATQSCCLAYRRADHSVDRKPR
jgi:MFS family permease